MTALDSQLLHLLSVSRLISILDEANDCHPQTSGAWQRGPLKCSHLCRRKSAVGRERNPEGCQCWWWEFCMWVCPASLAAACLSGSWWSTDRWRWAQKTVSVCLRKGQAWCIKGRAEVHKKDPRFVEVLQDVMQSHIDSIIHRPVWSVGKLKMIQQGSSDVFQVGQDQSLKWLYDHRRWCRGGRWMCEVQIRAGAVCQSGLFKSAVKHIEIISQLGLSNGTFALGIFCPRILNFRHILTGYITLSRCLPSCSSLRNCIQWKTAYSSGLRFIKCIYHVKSIALVKSLSEFGKNDAHVPPDMYYVHPVVEGLVTGWTFLVKVSI